MKHPIPIILNETGRASLQTFIHAGKANARTFTRARALLKAAEGWTDQQICEVFDISHNTSIRIRQVYLEGGLEAVLHDKRQERRRQALTEGQAAHVIAITCTPAPEGHDHWTLRRLSGQAVELGYVEGISPETIRQLLKKRTQALATAAMLHSHCRSRVCGADGGRAGSVRTTIHATPASALTKNSSPRKPTCDFQSH